MGWEGERELERMTGAAGVSDKRGVIWANGVLGGGMKDRSSPAQLEDPLRATLVAISFSCSALFFLHIMGVCWPSQSVDFKLFLLSRRERVVMRMMILGRRTPKRMKSRGIRGVGQSLDGRARRRNR